MIVILDFLLQEELKKRLRDKKINCPIFNEDKLRLSIKKLERYSKVSEHSIRYLIKAFAYFYVEVYQQLNLNQLYLKVGDFINHHNMDISNQIITEDDVALAQELENDWMEMNDFDVNTLPLPIRKGLSKSNVMVGTNTFFSYAKNPISFCKVANWINVNKMYYPQIHGHKEFFMHMPSEYGPNTYYPEQYYDSSKTLEKYYQRLYGDTPKEKRFDVFFSTLPPSMLKGDFFKNSNL